MRNCNQLFQMWLHTVAYCSWLECCTLNTGTAEVTGLNPNDISILFCNYLNCANGCDNHSLIHCLHDDTNSLSIIEVSYYYARCHYDFMTLFSPVSGPLYWDCAHSTQSLMLKWRQREMLRNMSQKAWKMQSRFNWSLFKNSC